MSTFGYLVGSVVSFLCSLPVLGQVLFTPALRKNVIAQNVNDVLHAAAYAGADMGDKIVAALADLPAEGGFIDARGLTGAQSTSAPITIPIGVTLLLGDVTLTSNSNPAFSIELDLYGSGSIRGVGIHTIIDYGGPGYAIEVNGDGEAATGLFIEDLAIQGSAAGIAGIHFHVFNSAVLRNVHVSGFTGIFAAGLLNEGANSIETYSCIFRDNYYGVRNVGVIVGSPARNYSVNAFRMIGGEVLANVGGGVYEDGSLASTVGANSANQYIGVTFENNGVNGSATAVNFFMQQAYSTSISHCHMEYNTVAPLSNITIGDAFNIPAGNSITNNAFFSVGCNQSISDQHSNGLYVAGNQEHATTDYFLLHDTLARNLVMIANRSAAVTIAVFGGFDTGVDTFLFPSNSALNILNGMTTTGDGLGIHTVSGLSPTAGLQVRNNGIAANTITLQDTDGNTTGSFTDTTWSSEAGVVIDVGGDVMLSGDLHFADNDGQHIETFSNNSDICGASSLSGGTRVITFTRAYVTNPIIFVTSNTTNPVVASSVSTTAFTVTGTGTDTFQYFVIGNPA